MSFPMRNRSRNLPWHVPSAIGRSAALLIALLTIGPELAAQDRTWPPQYRRDRPELALEASGSFASLQGNALGSATDGRGFDVMASLGVSVLSLGGGYQRSTHRVGGTDAVVQGVFFEPRLALPFVARNFTPFVYGRVASLERSIDASDGRQATRGTGLGAGIGTYVWIAPSIQLNTTLGWTDLRFGADDENSVFATSARTTGSSWGVRAGLTLGFDRWGR
jgi:hypothetical protein